MDYFQAWELVCGHVYRKYGNMSLMFADPRLLQWLAWFRTVVNEPVVINTYGNGGTLTQRGYRCNLCSLVKDATCADNLYLSAHTRFQAVDFNVHGMDEEEIIEWTDKRQGSMPVPIRIELGTVGWVHVDVAVPIKSNSKIIYFRT